MDKNEEFIFTEEFDRAVSEVKKEDYSKIQENLKKLAKRSLDQLSKDSKRI